METVANDNTTPIDMSDDGLSIGSLANRVSNRTGLEHDDVAAVIGKLPLVVRDHIEGSPEALDFLTVYAAGLVLGEKFTWAAATHGTVQ